TPCAIVTATKLTKAMGLSSRSIVVHHHINKALSALPQEQQRILIVADHADLQPLMATEEPLLHGDLLLFDQQGKVERHVDAKSLPKGFPYPDIDHDELRIRPAYYYRQSSVIPYRIGDDGIEILLITSSGGHHWVVPKGIHEPGLSAADSAAKEAWEEAGVIGVVAPEPLGTYSYTKWKSNCQITVFAMQVTEIADKDRWQESHRKRRWCPPDQAMNLLHQPDLTPLIQQLIQQLQSSP
ncbi:MAG: NUDIX hydrolase, partial [Mariprofundales bacterium]